MNGVSRGARLWALLDHTACPVIVLDKAPEGWWVAFEDHPDPQGRDLIEQRSARHLYPSRSVALGIQGKVGPHG